MKSDPQPKLILKNEIKKEINIPNLQTGSTLVNPSNS